MTATSNTEFNPFESYNLKNDIRKLKNKNKDNNDKIKKYSNEIQELENSKILFFANRKEQQTEIQDKTIKEFDLTIENLKTIIEQLGTDVNINFKDIIFKMLGAVANNIQIEDAGLIEKFSSILSITNIFNSIYKPIKNALPSLPSIPILDKIPTLIEQALAAQALVTKLEKLLTAEKTLEYNEEFNGKKDKNLKDKAKEGLEKADAAKEATIAKIEKTWEALNSKVKKCFDQLIDLLQIVIKNLPNIMNFIIISMIMELVSLIQPVLDFFGLALGPILSILIDILLMPIAIIGLTMELPEKFIDQFKNPYNRLEWLASNITTAEINTLLRNIDIEKYALERKISDAENSIMLNNKQISLKYEKQNCINLKSQCEKEKQKSKLKQLKIGLTALATESVKKQEKFNNFKSEKLDSLEEQLSVCEKNLDQIEKEYQELRSSITFSSFEEMKIPIINKVKEIDAAYSENSDKLTDKQFNEIANNILTNNPSIIDTKKATLSAKTEKVIEDAASYFNK